LRITEVSPDGLLAEWNDAHPASRLGPGDHILGVNGVVGDVVRMRGLLCSSRVQLQICRQPSASQSSLEAEEEESAITGTSPASGSRSRPQVKQPIQDELHGASSDPRAEALTRRIREAQAKLVAPTSTLQASRGRHSHLRSELREQDRRIKELEQQISSFQRPTADADASGLPPARLGASGLLDPDKDGDEEMDLQRKELHVAALMAEREEEIEELQQQLSRARQVASEPVSRPWQRSEDVPKNAPEISQLSDQAPPSLEALEAEEEMLLSSVREALVKITSRPTSLKASLQDIVQPRTPEKWLPAGTVGGAQFTQFPGCDDGNISDGTATLRGGENWQWQGVSASAQTTAPSTRQDSQCWAMAGLPSLRASGLPQTEFFTIASPESAMPCPQCGHLFLVDAAFCQFCGLRREAAQALQSPSQTNADEQVSPREREREATLAAQRRCQQLEAEVAAGRQEMHHLEELQDFQKSIHEKDMKHQAEILELRHRSDALLEQEQWQQWEMVTQSWKAERERSELRQEQEIHELLFRVEAERWTASELKAQQAGRENTDLKDLSARLAGRDLEILALESSLAAQRQLPALPVQAPEAELKLQVARHAQAAQEMKVREQAAELAELRQSESRAEEKLVAEMHRAEEEHKGRLARAEEEHKKEVHEIATRGQELEECLARMASALEESARSSPPSVPVEVQREQPQQSDIEAVKPEYVAVADDELDKLLEQQLQQLGPGTLKGNVLTRTGPKKYKLGEQKVFMLLKDGVVTVRAGGSYVPLAQWAKDLQAPGEQGDTENDPFSALDAASPFAAHA